MRFLGCLFLIVFIISPACFAYQAEDMQQCILSTKSNKGMESVKEISIEKFCNCALTLLVDEEKVIQESQSLINQCAKDSFGPS